jgi:hypothetical protein
MENKIEARATEYPFGCRTTGAATQLQLGDPSGEGLAVKSLFNDQLGGFPKDLFGDLLKRFGDESECAETSSSQDNGSAAIPDILLDVDDPFIPIDGNTPPVKIEIQGKEEIPCWQQGWMLVEKTRQKEYSGVDWGGCQKKTHAEIKCQEDLPIVQNDRALEAKKKSLAENTLLASDGRRLGEQIISEEGRKIIAATDRLELNTRALERARIALDVYNGPGEHVPPVGWKRLSYNTEALPPDLQDSVWEDPLSGFRAALYESEIDGSMVLAFRGTANKAGWKNNFQQGVGFKSEQYEFAIELAVKAKKTYGDNLEIVGHSLGGGLTSAGCIVANAPGYTFNGSGLHPNTVKSNDKTRSDGAQLIHAYHVTGEALTASQNSVLNAVYIPVGTSVRYARQANLINLYEAVKGEKPLNLQPVIVYDAVGNSHELPAVDENGESVSIIEANPVDRHGMDFVINGIEKQIADDKHAIIKFIANQ